MKEHLSWEFKQKATPLARVTFLVWFYLAPPLQSINKSPRVKRAELTQQLLLFPLLLGCCLFLELFAWLPDEALDVWTI